MDRISKDLIDWTPEISTAKKVSAYVGEDVYCYQCNRQLTKDLYFFSTFGLDLKSSIDTELDSNSVSYYCLCMSCYRLPNQIRHWLHPQHLLTLQTKRLKTYKTTDRFYGEWEYDVFCFVCDGCLYVSFGRVYVCQDCDFKCCIECSLSTATRMPIQWDHNKEPITHYIHLHPLTICRYKRRLDIENRDCLICELPLWGVCYACVRCFCFIHESCEDAPEQISHPIHPSHPLKRLNYAQDESLGVFCNGCSHNMYKGKHFFCEECGDFNLHLKCADSLLQTIIVPHELHSHALLYSMPPTDFTLNARCGLCNKSVSRNTVPFYRCVECDMAFHFKCIPIPLTFKHRYHMQPLSIMRSFSEGDCHCSICETSIDLNGHAYCCRQCKFVAHIACLLSKDEDSPKFLSCLSAAAAYRKEVSGNNNEEQIKHMGHKHVLRLSDVPTNLKHCKLCDLEIGDRAYACQQCDFWVHKRCAELPEELHHPLHPRHFLTLFESFEHCRQFKRLRYRQPFICDICTDVSDGFYFRCRVCDFIIDFKCGFATRKEIVQRRELDHSVFGHLQLVNPTGKFEAMSCKVCNQKISGLRYLSFHEETLDNKRCDFFHVTCIELALKVEDHPLHPNHPLILKRLVDLFDYYNNSLCGACGHRIPEYGYRCLAECRFSLHIECAHSPSRFLRHEVHHHRLYYFQRRPGYIVLKANDKRLEPTDGSTHDCNRCGRKIKIKGSYYRCVECKLHFHLKCLRLPRVVKHKWHLHKLAYKESVEFGGWYCDICEEKRDGEHPVYCCEDCKVAAHVDCLVSEENASNVKIEEIESQDAESGSDASEEIENEDTIAQVDNLSDEQEEESEEMDGHLGDVSEIESEKMDDNSRNEQEEESEEMDGHLGDVSEIESEKMGDNTRNEQEEESEEMDDNSSDAQEEESEGKSSWSYSTDRGGTIHPETIITFSSRSYGVPKSTSA